MTKKSPKVSIITITYNQEKFIEQALESFLSQKTKFDLEIIVSDDASSDKTPGIINKYAKKYPDLFKVTLRDKNVGPTANFYEALFSASGDYIALCEGDDYWTDSNKLQKQINFLEKNQDYALCFHRVNVFFDDNSQPETIFPSAEYTQENITLENLIRSNFIQTNSVVYRRPEYKNIDYSVAPVDWYMHLYHAQFGKIGFIDEVMSAYRRHPGGMWWKASQNEAAMWRKNSQQHLALYKEMLRMYPDKKTLVMPQVYHVINKSIKIGGGASTTTLEKFPIFGASYLSYLIKAHTEKDRYIKNVNNLCEKVNKKNQCLELELAQRKANIERLEQAEAELSRIQNTRIWRTARFLKRLIKK